MSSASGPKVATSGLILYLDPGNPKCYPGSGTTVTDLSYAGNDGTLLNGPTYSTSNSGVIATDGLNDYISVTNPSNNSLSWTPSGIGNNSLTCEIWVNSTDTLGYYVSKPWNGNGGYNYYMQHSEIFFNVTEGNSLSFTSLATGRWEHAAFIINPTQFAVYRNGVLNAGFSAHGISTSTVRAPGNISLPLALSTLYPYGSWAGNTGFSVLGNTAIFRFYNRALSADEILQNYDAVKGRFDL